MSIKNPLFFSLIFFTITLAAFFRTYNYFDRIYINADNARDIQIARYAASNLKIPQVGQFSSAAPFFYGPWYYWFLELFSFVPFGLLTHWYLATILSFLFIWLIFELGKSVGGNWVGAAAALFAAVSPAQITNSLNVWNPSIIPLLALIALVLLIRFYKLRDPWSLFFLGFTVSLAITVHFQSILTLPIIFAAALLIFKIGKNTGQKLKYLFILSCGFVVPFLPLLKFDIQNNWYNSKSLIIYLAIDQFKIWVPNRWLTYLIDYWPSAWAGIFAGYKLLGLLTITLLSVFTLLNLRFWQKYKEGSLHSPSLRSSSLDKLETAGLKVFYIIAVIFVLEVVIYRYFRGQRYDYYTLFAHPYVFVLTAWLTAQIFKKNRFLGFLWVALIFLSTISRSFETLKPQELNLPQVVAIKNQIYNLYPQEKFDLYACKTDANSGSRFLSVAIYMDKREAPDGLKIGLCGDESERPWQVLTDVDVENEKNWSSMSTAAVYKDTIEWWQTNPIQKDDNFWQFLKENL